MAGRSARYVVVDVFTAQALQGNQLGVFTDARGLSEDEMQSLTREFNFSECTFVLPAVNGGDARIRIFTPAHELPFAGHPTLGTAYVIAGLRQSDEVRIETLSGVVPVRFVRDAGRIVSGRMEQPIPTVTQFAQAADLLAALRVKRSELPVDVYDNGVRHVYVALGSEEQVAGLRPDVGAIAGLGRLGVNCFAGAGTRWKMRMFAPAMGVIEDAATGSAAGPLAMHLARHGRIPWGEEIEISQGAEIERPSTLFARAVGGPEGVERVEVGGTAVVVARGEVLL